MLEVSHDEFGGVTGYEFQFVYSCLYVVYGSVFSGVNVNQDKKRLWELSGKVERAGEMARSSMSVLHSSSLMMTVEHQCVFT